MTAKKRSCKKLGIILTAIKMIIAGRKAFRNACVYLLFFMSLKKDARITNKNKASPFKGSQ